MEGVAVHHGQDRFGQEKHFLEVIKEQMCFKISTTSYTVSKYKTLK